MKNAAIGHALEMMARLHDYQKAITVAQVVAHRIVSSLKAVALNADLLMASPPGAAHSRGTPREDYALAASQVQTLALIALAAANSTAAAMQASLPQTASGVEKLKNLLADLDREDEANRPGSNLQAQALAEIDGVIRRLEETAMKSMAAVRDLMPQVKRLHRRMTVLAAGGSEDDLEITGPATSYPPIMEIH